MAHDITQRSDGIAEAGFYREGAWHGLGEITHEVLSARDFMSFAHLDWEVIQKELAICHREQRPTPEGPVDVLVADDLAEGLYANVRHDSGLCLGVVSDQYKLVQNIECFDFMDDLIEDGSIVFESGFSLSGGKRVVITARLPAVDEIVAGDDQKRYILLSTSHDGTGAIRFGCVSVRVVCANTYTVALEEKASKDGEVKAIRELSIRHTGRITDKLAEARAIVAAANNSLADYADHARALAAHAMSEEAWREYLDILCPLPAVNDPDYTPARAKSIRETRTAIGAAYWSGARNNLVGMRQTAWAAFNAVTDYCDHLPRRGATRARRAEARFNVSMYGAGRDQKERAFATACRFAGV